MTKENNSNGQSASMFNKGYESKKVNAKNQPQSQNPSNHDLSEQAPHH